MNIRTRVTLMFSGLVILLISGISLAIYFFSADYRRESFYQRLKNKAENTAKLLIEVEEVNAELLRRIESDNPSKPPNERIIIYNFKNQELYSSDVGNVLKIDSVKLNKIRLSKEIRFTQGEFEVLGFLYIEKYDRFAVVAAATDIYGLNKLGNLRDILVFIFLFSIVIVPISGWVYAGRALNPISVLVNQTEAISATQLERRLFTNNKTDEIGKLVQTFNHMLDRLEEAFRVQKSFIANASHELRTPLTSITGEIEVTLLQPRSAEHYQSVLTSVLDESKNLGLLLNQLLLLAQTSADAPGQNMRTHRVDELLWQCKDEISKAYSDYRIDINLDASLDDNLLTIRGDEQLLKTAFYNLMDNGCKYSENNTVSVRLQASVNGIDIEFENNGAGISASELASIFQPFFRGKNTQNVKGHGIGLSLVNGIITLHSGSIHVSSTAGEKTNFTISLPLSESSSE